MPRTCRNPPSQPSPLPPLPPLPVPPMQWALSCAAATGWAVALLPARLWTLAAAWRQAWALPLGVPWAWAVAALVAVAALSQRQPQPAPLPSDCAAFQDYTVGRTTRPSTSVDWPATSACRREGVRVRVRAASHGPRRATRTRERADVLIWQVITTGTARIEQCTVHARPAPALTTGALAATSVWSLVRRAPPPPTHT